MEKSGTPWLPGFETHIETCIRLLQEFQPQDKPY